MTNDATIALMFREFIIRIGRVWSVLIATMLATVSSVVFAYIVMFIKGVPFNDNALTISILAPLTIAPFLFWPLFSAFIKIHHLEQEMRRLAMIDELTGIMNRRAFLSNVEYTINLAKRSQAGLALVYIDLDNFKTINDAYGHAAGDEVLRRFASIAGSIVRKTDVVGRLGGEEFAMLVYGANKEAAQHLIERLLVEVRNTRVPISGYRLHFTASAGLVYLEANERTSVEQLLVKADKALQQAKRTGKDRLVICEAM